MERIECEPIGIIESPYKEPDDMPIQGCFKAETEACCILYKEYETGLQDLDGFSHAILIYYFHKSMKTELLSQPFLEKVQHGIFSIRSPHRPNKIGFSIVKINRIKKNKLYFSEVDVFDGTPLLDIKPFVKHFDERKNVISGWVDKHFNSQTVPEQTILRKK